MHSPTGRCVVGGAFLFLLFLMVRVNFLKIKIISLKTYFCCLRCGRHFKGAFYSVERSCHLSGAQQCFVAWSVFAVSGAYELRSPEGRPSSAA